MENSRPMDILMGIPSIIMWELWKRRNAIKHGKMVTFSTLVERCELAVHQMCRMKYSRWLTLPKKWDESLVIMQKFRKRLFYKVVIWKYPEDAWVKCNTDGVSKGNPGISTYAFCVRDSNGNLLYAEANNIGLATNVMAEATSVLKAIHYGR